LRFLEEWLARDPGEKDYIKNADLLQANYEKQIRKPYNSGMDEEDVEIWVPWKVVPLCL
jgi:hypothetical protein